MEDKLVDFNSHVSTAHDMRLSLQLLRDGSCLPWITRECLLQTSITMKLHIPAKRIDDYSEYECKTIIAIPKDEEHEVKTYTNIYDHIQRIQPHIPPTIIDDDGWSCYYGINIVYNESFKRWDLVIDPRRNYLLGKRGPSGPSGLSGRSGPSCIVENHD
jgi:hypothetical protein